MKGLVIVEGREEFEKFAKSIHCYTDKALGFDDVKHLDMVVMWVSDLDALRKEIDKLLFGKIGGEK